VDASKSATAGPVPTRERFDMPLISDIFNIPAQVHQGDFVLRLTEGVERAADTLST
jgi:hypothetical protein